MFNIQLPVVVVCLFVFFCLLLLLLLLLFTLQKRSSNQGVGKCSAEGAVSTHDMDSGLGINQRFSQDSRDSIASVGMDSGVGMKQEFTSHELKKHSPKVKIGKT